MQDQNNIIWAEDEFSNVDLSDKRLNKRLIKLCASIADCPESPINQVCADWAETKAAYRFFNNEHVQADKIIKAHSHKTIERAKKQDVILAIQDTSYLVYTSHKKTKGLGKISLKKGKNIDKIYSKGLIMHSCLAVTTKGFPLGILDQKIFARKSNPKPKGRARDLMPIEEKESYRWIESVQQTKQLRGKTKMVTVCDREADFYEFFQFNQEIEADFLVRANVNRNVNKKSRYAQKEVTKLWEFMDLKAGSGHFDIEVPAKNQTKHSDDRKARTATLQLKFASFRLNPPRNNRKHKDCKLPDLPMHAIHVVEINTPSDDEPIEWMLLTNLAVNDFEQAYEIVQWYCLRWRIEMFFKVLKSGFKILQCRLSDAERLKRYITVVSVIAWRLLALTLLARTDPQSPCNRVLGDREWKVLYLKVHKNKSLPKRIPRMREVVIWIARLGGFLARKGDGEPGMITLWRGWRRLNDIVDGWTINETLTCG